MSSANPLNILQICRRVPFPPTDGGAIAMYDVAKGLSDNGHNVTILAINTPKHFQEQNVLQDVAKLETIFVNTNISPINAFFNLFKKIPYNVERFISSDVETKIKQLLSENKFDVIQFEGTFVAYYIDVVNRLSNVKTILRVHNLEYRIWKRLAFNTSNPFKKWYLNYLSKGLKKFEKEYFTKFTALASISEIETPELARNFNKNTLTIPAGVNFNRFPDLKINPEQNSMFILSSLNWQPNIEAVLWFLNNVMPLVLEKNRNIKLHIAGKNPPNEILKFKSLNVIIHGFVESANEFMQQYQLMLVPLLSGGGMRIKIIEGMAAIKCIISSKIGAEGIDYTEGENIIICESPQEWAEKIIEILNDSKRLTTIGNNSKKLVSSKYSNETIVKQFEALYSQ